MDGIVFDRRETLQWLDAFFQNYYRSGERQRLKGALGYAAGAYGDHLGGESTSDSISACLALYFFARVARLDPTALAEYEALGASPPRWVAPAESRRFVETVLWLARAERVGPPPQSLPPHFPVDRDVLEQPPRSGVDLDYLWIEFCATGRREPVLRVVEVLRWPDRIRVKLADWLTTPVVGPLGRWRRHRVLRRLERVAGIRCDAGAAIILTPGDLDCLCTVGPQAQREASRFPAVRAALPFQLGGEEVAAIATKGMARWSLLSLSVDHPTVREVWQAEMPDDIAQAIAIEASRPRPVPAGSLGRRALLTLLLAVGFLALVVGAAGGLLAIAALAVRYGGALGVKLAVGCAAAAGTILWAMLPRPDRFVAPGPRLTAESQPRLFAELSRVAGVTGQPMPADVYLDPGVNAWVAQRGGIMTLGSRRVMALGLPLLQVLTVSQLRAVLAHEFGHYHAGDTRLGPWIYQIRAAIVRTVQALTEKESVLRAPFVAYARLFLRVSHAVSRQQELAADALAADAVAARALADGLRAISRASALFGAYVDQELAPVLNAGFRPPIADGFALFARSRWAADVAARVVDAQVLFAVADPYDTHPPLRERLAAVAGLPAGEVPAADPPAIALLDAVSALEEALVSTGNPSGRSLRPLPWDEVVTKVWIPQDEDLCRRHGSALKGETLRGLPVLVPRLADLGRALAREVIPEDQARAFGAANVAAAMRLALRRAGWELRAVPGEAIAAHRADGAVVVPGDVLGDLGSRVLTAEQWRRQCADLGIADLDLGVFAPAGPAASTT